MFSPSASSSPYDAFTPSVYTLCLTCHLYMAWLFHRTTSGGKRPHGLMWTDDPPVKSSIVYILLGNSLVPRQSIDFLKFMNGLYVMFVSGIPLS